MLLKDIRSYSGIYIACGFIDFRKSIDGLANMVRDDFDMDPFGNYLFLFTNRQRNRLKCLTWDKNGFWLGYKRLDGMGARFQWPKNPEDVRSITTSELQLLLDGLSVDPPKGFGEISARDF